MVAPNPAANDRRLARRVAKLGPNAACAICGERNLIALVLHGHHVGLEANDPVAVCALCLNHHAVAQERLRQIGVVEWEAPADNFIDRQVAMLRSEADFLRLLAESRDQAADAWEAFTRWLDGKELDWRGWPEAEQ
jgi:hypothetical protein